MTDYLVLHVKGEYFDAIKSGTKKLEYRLCNEYWRKRLENRTYREVVIFRGYPRKGDKLNMLEFPYKGYKHEKITHKHFGNVPVEVYAIILED